VPPSASPLGGDVGLVSDYRYVGVSLSDGHPALQGSLRIEHDGFYGTLWASALDRIGDPANSDIDVSAGYERGAFDEVRHGGKWDWSLGGALDRGPARLGLAYVGSTADHANGHALVGAATVSW
jgi:hypothetical protein